MTPSEADACVRELWQVAVESIIEKGRRLIEAKRRVPHGQWPDAVGLMPSHERTARYLMEFADHPDLSNRNLCAVLPASWRTLAVLAKLPAGEILKLTEQGQITPELEGKGIRDCIERTREKRLYFG